MKNDWQISRGLLDDYRRTVIRNGCPNGDFGGLISNTTATESPKWTDARFIPARMIRSRGTFSPSKWHHHRGGCRHGNSILRAYYVKVVRSWNAARHDSFLRRLSPRFRTNTLKAPPTLTATVASEKLARFFQCRSTTPERSLSDSKPDAR